MVLTDIPEVPAFKVILPAENRVRLPKRTYSTIKANNTEKVAKINNTILSLIKLLSYVWKRKIKIYIILTEIYIKLKTFLQAAGNLSKEA